MGDRHKCVSVLVLSRPICHDDAMKHSIIAIALWPSILWADPAVVEDVRATEGPSGWRFDVTLSHGDTGWDDYADGWRVLAPDGTELGYRELFHPHVEEQPFTRSLSGVVIPEGLETVWIESRTNTDGWSGARIEFDLTK